MLPKHPPFRPGEGLQEADKFKSPIDVENISFPLIEHINQTLPARFNGMEIQVVAVGVYAPIEGYKFFHHFEAVDVVLQDTKINQGPVAVFGYFTGAGFTYPYLIGPAYYALRLALAAPDEVRLVAWYDRYFFGPVANYSNFRHAVGDFPTALSAIPVCP